MIDLEKYRQLAFGCCKSIILSWLVIEYNDAVYQDETHTAEVLQGLIERIGSLTL